MAFQPYNHKKELSKPERFVGGHRLCAGCGAGIVCRGITRALDEGDKAVICNATGCLEVSSFLYPYTSWTDSYIHSAFENASATCGGVEAWCRAVKASYSASFSKRGGMVSTTEMLPRLSSSFFSSSSKGWAS